MEKKLVGKLAEKLADFKHAVGHSKVAKRVISLVLAGALTFPIALSSSACSGFIIKNNGDGSYTITPRPNENENEQGNQQGGDEQGGNEQGGNEQGGNEQGNTNKGPDLSKYSPLLQEVLTNPKYDALIYGDKRNTLVGFPYEYISTREDVSDVFDKDCNTTSVDSDLFFRDDDPDHIYIITGIFRYLKNSDYRKGIRYINQYLLKYEINEQEKNEIIDLYRRKICQGPLMVQALANSRTPEVLSETTLTEGGESMLLSCVNNSHVFANLMDNQKFSQFSILSVNQFEAINNIQAYRFRTYFYTKPTSSNAAYKRTIYEMESGTPIEDFTPYENTYHCEGYSSYEAKCISKFDITYVSSRGFTIDLKTL